MNYLIIWLELDCIYYLLSDSFFFLTDHLILWGLILFQLYF